MPPQVRSEEIVVVGAGVIGLTTANLLQQKISERACVTLLAAELPTPSPTTKGASDRPDPSTDYASMWAGAHYRPVPYLSPSHPSYGSLPGEKQRLHSQLAQESQWAIRTAEIMKRIAGSEPEAGVQIMSAAEFLENPSAENWTLKSGDVYASPDDNFRVLDASEIDELNRQATPDGESVKWACEYETYVVNVHVYCAWLLQRFRAKGGRVIQQRLNNFSEALGIAGAGRHLGQSKPVIVNCSGLSTNLTRDPNTKIIRGQTVLVQQQYHSTKTRVCANGVWSFLIPRPLNGGTIVGGTKQVDDYEPGVRQEERQRLLENAVKYFPDFVQKVSDFTILKDNVGRRPWREGGMRIELEEIRPEGRESMSLKVVHGYGAGGRGYELSWGAAAAICKLVEQCLPQETKL